MLFEVITQSNTHILSLQDDVMRFVPRTISGEIACQLENSFTLSIFYNILFICISYSRLSSRQTSLRHL